MKIDIKIFSKGQVEDDKRELIKDRILISILSPIETPLAQKIKDKYKDVLELKFEDFPYDPLLIPECSCHHHSRVFDYCDYIKIKQFIEKHDEVSIDVHCGAGISRSAAVAFGITFLKNDLKLMKETIINNHNVSPNERILCFFRIFANPHHNGLNMKNLNYYLREKKGFPKEHDPEFVFESVTLKEIEGR